jgi:hypothetical protein
MTLARNLYQIRTLINDFDDVSLAAYKAAVLKMLGTKKRILVDLVKESEERVFLYNSNV